MQELICDIYIYIYILYMFVCVFVFVWNMSEPESMHVLVFLVIFIQIYLVKLSWQFSKSDFQSSCLFVYFRSNDPHTATGQLLSDLCPIIVWMVNALELFHHFRQHLIDYLMDPELSLTSQTRASVATAGDEVIGTLEEVVMYTFQQTVYYLTKVGLLFLRRRTLIQKRLIRQSFIL